MYGTLISSVWSGQLQQCHQLPDVVLNDYVSFCRLVHCVLYMKVWGFNFKMF